MRTLPTPRALEELLGGLLGRGARVALGPQLSLYTESPLAIGRYVDNAGKLAAACICDLRFACHAGASLTMVPSSVADANIKLDQLPEALAENLREVMNIIAQLFNHGGSHVVMERLVVQPPPLEDEVLLLLRRQRADYEVNIEGYGPGSLS